MAFSKDDVIELITIFDAYYVRKSDCAETQAKNNSRFASDDKKIDLLAQRLERLEGIFKIIASASIATLVTSILSLILK